jgi:SAM-dependent methyltransferase
VTGRVDRPVRVSPGWLDLREAADAAARAADLVAPLLAALPDPLVVHDLGCGTGSMTRWLAPLLPGPQHWVLHDLDRDLLDVAVGRTAGLRAADGSAVTVTARVDDVTRLGAADLVGAGLVTGSALLDVLDEDELQRLVRACVTAGCPVLMTLTVVGRVALAPAEPLDAELAAAFNDHQRRPGRTSRLCGPDALPAAAAAIRAAGCDVRLAPSPWRLGGDSAELALAWLAGWVEAAGEVRPDLAGELTAYVHRRSAQAAAGELAVTVHHGDLLALPARR